jgi:hypothetical protein
MSEVVSAVLTEDCLDECELYGHTYSVPALVSVCRAYRAESEAMAYEEHWVGDTADQRRIHCILTKTLLRSLASKLNTTYQRGSQMLITTVYTARKHPSMSQRQRAMDTDCLVCIRSI